VVIGLVTLDNLETKDYGFKNLLMLLVLLFILKMVDIFFTMKNFIFFIIFFFLFLFLTQVNNFIASLQKEIKNSIQSSIC
jgi:hypothetical protein